MTCSEVESKLLILSSEPPPFEREGPFPFMKLPLEIRRMIYEYYFAPVIYAIYDLASKSS